MSEEQKKLLEQQLWNIANELRGRMDADEFRDYILGFIFFKYLSEKQYIYANELLETETVKDYLNLVDTDDLEAIRDESLIKLGYFLKPNELFRSIAKRGNKKVESLPDGQAGNFILEDLETILNSIEQTTMGTDSEDDFNKLFEDLDLSSTKLGRTVEARNTLIAKVLSHLDKIDFEIANVDSDVLGDAYEYLIGQFASGAGKKAGEFYTPQQVSKILAKIVTTGKKRLKTVYDPTCGSGSLLLRVAKEVAVSDFYGQELNRTTYNLARMNMILHDVHYSKFDIKQEDTLVEPQHFEQRFEAIVANPPFSAKWKGKDNPLNDNDERFSQYGKLAPTSKADFAFVQHMIHQLAENGTMACVLPHGVLFRGSAEATIREYIIDKQNYLDAVIGLPANIFFGTSIPTCILVLSKCRVNNDDILFIDASNDFEKDGNKNKLTEEHIAKIISTYQTYIKGETPLLRGAGGVLEDKYSYVATIDEIKANDYNLNIPRYVDTFEEEEAINLDEVANALKALDKDIAATDNTIADFCKQLNIATPF
ncbi:MAG: type I restriction-modification system subunit M [Flavobacteriales bacterium]|nr:MAG: type I restriction-modification system subunit M [Flavobacteriales bacterium]